MISLQTGVVNLHLLSHSHYHHFFRKSSVKASLSLLYVFIPSLESRPHFCLCLVMFGVIDGSLLSEGAYISSLQQLFQLLDQRHGFRGQKSVIYSEILSAEILNRRFVVCVASSELEIFMCYD